MHPLVQIVRHIKLAPPINSDCDRVIKLAFAATQAPEFRQKTALTIELFDPVVRRVRHVYIALGVETQTANTITELAVTLTLAAPLEQEFTVQIKLLDAVVTAISDINMALTVRPIAVGYLK